LEEETFARFAIPKEVTSIGLNAEQLPKNCQKAVPPYLILNIIFANLRSFVHPKNLYALSSAHLVNSLDMRKIRPFIESSMFWRSEMGAITLATRRCFW
jgi:hypothetical protein